MPSEGKVRARFIEPPLPKLPSVGKRANTLGPHEFEDRTSLEHEKIRKRLTSNFKQSQEGAYKVWTSETSMQSLGVP